MGAGHDVREARTHAAFCLLDTLAALSLSGRRAIPDLDLYVRALLERKPLREKGTLSWGSVRVDVENRTVEISGSSYRSLPTRHFALICLMVRRRGHLVSRRRILRELWHLPVRDKEVDVLVSRLRSHLRPEHRGLIVPVPGAGYRLVVAT